MVSAEVALVFSSMVKNNFLKNHCKQLLISLHKFQIYQLLFVFSVISE